MKKMSVRIFSLASLGLVSSFACANGLQLPAQSASGLGVAYAGSATVAEDVTTAYANPAGLVMLPGRQAAVVLLADDSSYRFRDQGSTGLGIGGGNGGDAGSLQLPAAAYLSWQLNGRWTAGLAISSPFGLKTEYDTAWTGRYQAIGHELKTRNINPSLAYQWSERLSLGFGLNYQRAEFSSSALDAAGNLDAFKGDAGAWGWNVGALWNLSPAMRLGASYRSGLRHKLQGHDQLSGQDANLRLELPASFTFSVWQQLSERWEAMGDLSWIGNGSLDPWVAQAGNGTQLFSRDPGLRNTWRLAWGAAYKSSENLKYRFGLAYARSAVGEGGRTAALPTNGELWFSLGAQWRPFKNAAFDLGYAYRYMRDARIEQGNAGNTAVLRGEYDARAHLLGLQYTQSF